MSEASRTATVVDSRRLSEHVCALTLASDEPLSYLPGQWLSLQLPVGERPPLIRAYSLATPESSDRRFELCFDRVENGLGSGYLWSVEAGETIFYTGPHGNFTVPDTQTPLVFAARYTGIVPLRAMLLALDQQRNTRPVTLIYGAPSASERIYHDELTELASRAAWLTYRPVDDGDEADALGDFPENGIALVCGVRPFTKPVREAWMERFGVDRRAIRLENYSGA